MATATPNTSQIPAPRVPLIDERTGLVSQQWFRWFNNIYALTGSGAGITPVTNGGTGTGNIPTNGQLLIGNGTDYSLSVITAGANITITNTAGHITIASAGALSSFSAGTTGFTPSTPTTGAITLAGTLIAANGGTGFASYAVGDLLYANTTTTLAKLADVATGNALISGGVSTAPSWGKIGLTTHVSGTLPIANGGTNATATTTGIRKSVKPASDNSCHVPYTDYRRELPAARDRRRRWIDQQVNEAMRAGFAIGVVTGMIIAGGICWLVASLL